MIKFLFIPIIVPLNILWAYIQWLLYNRMVWKKSVWLCGQTGIDSAYAFRSSLPRTFGQFLDAVNDWDNYKKVNYPQPIPNKFLESKAGYKERQLLNRKQARALRKRK